MTLTMIRSSGPIWIGLLVAPWLSSQPGLTFDVASVKVANTPNGVRGGCHGIDSVYTPGQQALAAPLGRCVITDARLSHLIGIAYGVSMTDLKTGPDWIQRGDLRFNVEAKAEDPKATEQQLITMLQNLLEERFQLKFHKETREVAGFALNCGQGGTKTRVIQEYGNADLLQRTGRQNGAYAIAGSTDLDDGPKIIAADVGQSAHWSGRARPRC